MSGTSSVSCNVPHSLVCASIDTAMSFPWRPATWPLTTDLRVAVSAARSSARAKPLSDIAPREVLSSRAYMAA